MATLTAVVLALIEGCTDLPLSGVFGAGKTRSAGILMVGLLVLEPDLKLMILTKENVAAQAFADHIVSFGLPEGVTTKTGRLVWSYKRTRPTRLQLMLHQKTDMMS